MKRFLLLIVLLFNISLSFSQGESALKKGHAQINFGYPPLFGVDYAINDLVTIGIKSSLQGYFLYYVNNPFGVVGIVSDFHFNKLMNLADNKDVYVGLNLYTKLDDYDTQETQIPFPGIQFGSRWFWSDSFGIGAEVGFSVSVIFGISFTARL